MSFILDALRKSDAKRHAEQPPGLDQGPPPGQPRRPPKPRARRIVLGITGVLLVGLVVVGIVERDRLAQELAGWVGDSDRSVADNRGDAPETMAVATEQPTQPEPPPATESGLAQDISQRADPADPETGLPRERIVSDPDEIQRRLERMVAEQNSGSEPTESSDELAPQSRNRRVVRQPTNIIMAAPRQDAEERLEREAREREALAEMEQRMAAAQARREARARAAARRNAEPEPQPEPEPELEVAAVEQSPVAETAMRTQPSVAREASPETTVEDSRIWAPEAPEYVRIWELPLSIRRNLPELKLNIHVFSDEPRQRFVLVNGERFRIGDTLADGVRLVEIRREGAIVDFRDYRFLLAP